MTEWSAKSALEESTSRANSEKRLRALSPETYLGLAIQLVEQVTGIE